MFACLLSNLVATLAQQQQQQQSEREREMRERGGGALGKKERENMQETFVRYSCLFAAC